MACVCLLPAGCGDPLADGAYRGEPLYAVEGPLLLASVDQLFELAGCQEQAEICGEAAYAGCEADGNEDDACPEADACFADFEECLAGEGTNLEVLTSEIDLGVSLVWSDPDNDGDVFEQPTTIAPGLPARYTLTLYQPPPESALHQTEHGAYAVGVLIAYEDIDRNGRIDTEYESVLGGSTELAVLYTPDGIDHPELGHFGAGFHRVVPIDDWCDTREGARFDVPDEDRSPITFGRLDQLVPMLLPNLDCRDGRSEWGLCPADAALDRCDDLHPPLYCAFCDTDGGEDEGDDGDDGDDGEDDPDDPEPEPEPDPEPEPEPEARETPRRPMR